MQAWYKKFSSQPHQPFFTSGILFLILFMMLFTASYSNILILDTSVLTFHAYTMVFVIFIQFFLGFLFVVFPRFLTQAEINQKFQDAVNTFAQAVEDFSSKEKIDLANVLEGFGGINVSEISN